MIEMEHLYWELNVLSRASQYHNLSAAAGHIGISQPQLSRIISKLESELNIVLLDRTARRKSGWLPIAFELSQIYSLSSRKLNWAIEQLQESQSNLNLQIGCLEGLGQLAAQICQQLFVKFGVRHIELNVFDLNDLEEQFERHDLDLIFTFREPGRKKNKFIKQLGVQEFKDFNNANTVVLSTFEFEKINPRKIKEGTCPTFISNSLNMRKYWLETYGGKGQLPTEVKANAANNKKKLTPVFVIGSELFNSRLWAKLFA